MIGLKDLEDKIFIPFNDTKDFCSNYIMSIVLKNSEVYSRDKVRSDMQDRGIQTSNHYPPAHSFSFYDNQLELPKTTFVSENQITLPMYSKLKSEDVKFICQQLKEVLL